jgi:hypothetical protein
MWPWIHKLRGEGKFMKRLRKEQRKDISALAAMKNSDIDLTDV